jgi:exonuclease III
MASRVHRPLKVLTFNANGIARHPYELSKQLQGLHTDVALLSETHLKPREMFFIPKYHVYRIDLFLGRKGRTAVAVRKGIPHSNVDLPSLVSIEATGVCISIDNSEILLAGVYKSAGHAWFDADIIELLSFRHKSNLAGGLNGDLLDIVVGHNMRLSGVIISDILDSDHLPVVFHILDHIKIKSLSEPVEKFTD